MPLTWPWLSKNKWLIQSHCLVPSKDYPNPDLKISQAPKVFFWPVCCLHWQLSISHSSWNCSLLTLHFCNIISWLVFAGLWVLCSMVFAFRQYWILSLEILYISPDIVFPSLFPLLYFILFLQGIVLAQASIEWCTIPVCQTIHQLFARESFSVTNADAIPKWVHCRIHTLSLTCAISITVV